MKKSGFLTLGSAGLLAAFIMGAPAAFATVVAPGTSDPPDILPFGDGAIVASTSGPFTSVLGASDFSGAFMEDVRSDPDNTFGAGDLTWYIEVTNNSSSGTALETVSASSFSGWMTDVGYVTVLPGLAPTTVSRGPSGATVNFLFPAPGSINPGDSTVWLTIMTNATRFKTGNISFIDEGTATVGGFAPSVPEPATWAMMLLGFAGLSFAGYRKTRNAVSIAL